MFTLNLNDLLKGVAVAAITTIAARLIPVFDAESLPSLTELVNCAKVGLAAGLSYLLKNIITNVASK